jgi:hypothetical protein
MKVVQQFLEVELKKSNFEAFKRLEDQAKRENEYFHASVIGMIKALGGKYGI